MLDQQKKLYYDAYRNITTNFGGVDKLYQELEVLEKQLNAEAFSSIKKGMIVLLVSTWEAFVEDMAIGAFEVMLSNQDNLNNVTSSLKKSIHTKLSNSKHEFSSWKLAGDSWIDECRVMAKKKVENFHTPNAKNTNELFKFLIGGECISNEWYWENETPMQAEIHLKEIICVRSEIAHKATCYKYPLTSESLKKYIWFIWLLITYTALAVDKRLLSLDPTFKPLQAVKRTEKGVERAGVSPVEDWEW